MYETYTHVRNGSVIPLGRYVFRPGTVFGWLRTWPVLKQALPGDDVGGLRARFIYIAYTLPSNILHNFLYIHSELLRPYDASGVSEDPYYRTL